MPERTRLLLVVGEVAGGIAAHVRSLAEDLEGLDVDVTVMGPVSSLAAMKGCPLAAARVPAPVGRPTPVAWWRVRRDLRRRAGGGVVVHAHGLRAGAAATAVRGRAPLVVTWHNAPLGGRASRAVHERLERWVARRSDVTLAASEDLAVRARTAGGRDVRVVSVTSPLPPPARTREQVRASLGVEGETPLVLSVARLHPQKRLDVLVAAAAGWPQRGSGARRVVVAGEGPSRDRLAAAISASAAPVRLLGKRDDVADLLHAADVMVLTSQWEARSLAVQEALRAGVPVVCTDAGALPGLVGDAALVVPVGDAQAVRTAVDRVLGDEELRTRLIRRGMELAATWPSHEREAADLNRLYLDLGLR